MSVLLVAYDLNKPGQNYQTLYNQLKSYTHCHAQESVWYLDTASAPADVRAKLQIAIDASDQLFVVRMHQHWAAAKSDHATQWLQSASRTWD